MKGMVNMRAIKWLTKSLRGLIDAIARFPLTTVFLIVAAIINAIDINKMGEDYTKYLLTFIVGAFLSAVMEVAYERWFSKPSTRLLLMGGVLLLTAGYYFIITAAPEMSMEVSIRTAVALFALLISFIWVPVIKVKSPLIKAL